MRQDILSRKLSNSFEVTELNLHIKKKNKNLYTY